MEVTADNKPTRKDKRKALRELSKIAKLRMQADCEIRAEIHCHDALLRSNHRFSLAVNYEFWKHNTKCILYYPPLKTA